MTDLLISLIFFYSVFKLSEDYPFLTVVLCIVFVSALITLFYYKYHWSLLPLW